MNVRQYIRNFYNNELLRHFRFIKLNPEAKYKVDDLKLPNDPKLDFKDFTEKWILKRYNKQLGSLAGAISYFNNIGDYREDDSRLVYTDRLFYDFDLDDPVLKKIKKNILKCFEDLKGKDRIKAIKQHQQEYIEQLFNSNSLRIAYDEVMKLYNYFVSKDHKPYLVFSGSKGFHLYLFIGKTYLKNIAADDGIIYTLANDYKKAFNLTSLDLEVNKDPSTRLARLPYSIHGVTGLYTTPCRADEDLTEILERSRTRKVEEFYMQDYIAADDFRKALIIKDNEMTAEKAKQEEFNNFVRSILGETITNGSNINKDLIFKDFRELAKLILGQPAAEYDHYNTYKCPFHDDKRPSAFISKYKFTCKSEGLELKYFEFIKKYFNLATDDEVRLKMKELVKEAATSSNS